MKMWRRFSVAQFRPTLLKIVAADKPSAVSTGEWNPIPPGTPLLSRMIESLKTQVSFSVRGFRGKHRNLQDLLMDAIARR